MKNSVFESLIFSLYLIIQIRKSDMHKLIRSRATLGLNQSKKHTTGCHQHKYENRYYDDALLNLSVVYIYIISSVPKLTIVALYKLIPQILKLPPQFDRVLVKSPVGQKPKGQNPHGQKPHGPKPNHLTAKWSKAPS